MTVLVSLSNITGPITVDSSDSKGVVSRAAQSSDGGSVDCYITLFRWTHKPRGTGHLHQIVQYILTSGPPAFHCRVMCRQKHIPY